MVNLILPPKNYYTQNNIYPIINFEVVSACMRVPHPDVACVWNKSDRLPTSGGVAAR